MIKLRELLMKNWIIIFYIESSIIFELTAVRITSHSFLISNPSMLFIAILMGAFLLWFIRSQRIRYYLTTILMLIHGIIDIFFITVYDMTGQVFDYSMLTLKKDAMAILESIPFNVLYLYIFGIIFSAFVVFGKRFVLLTKDPIYLKKRVLYMPAVMLVLSISFSSIAFSVVDTANFYDQMLNGEKTNSYKDYGVIGNTAQALASGFNSVEISKSDSELTEYFYRNEKYSNFRSQNYNVVLMLCESFEWISFIEDLEKYPNGLNITGSTEKRNKDVLRALFPNLYDLYDNGLVMSNFHSREKTDVSENYGLLGAYPTRNLTNYTFAENAYNASLPNVLKLLRPGLEASYFHNGTRSFYNREEYMPSLGFDNIYFEEELVDLGMTDWRSEGERNLDSDMIRSAKDYMFVTDRPFFTQITTITGHGQYSYRTSFEGLGYYDLLALYGMVYDPQNIASDNDFITYVCTALELDRAIGEVNKALKEKGLYDNTILAIYGDHNTYYNGLSEYVKGFRTPDDANELNRDFLDLYQVPFMLRVPNMPHQVIDKFMTTADIMPTILDVLGINYFSNYYYGNSAFDLEESIMYSRSYNYFASDKILFNSLSSIRYQYSDDLMTDLVKLNTRKLVNKIEYIDALYYNDYFNRNSTTISYGDFFNLKLKKLNGCD